MAQQVNFQQGIVDAIGSNVLTGVQLKQATGYDKETLQREVFALIKEGVVINDGGKFSLNPEWLAQAQGEDGDSGGGEDFTLELDEAPQASKKAPTAAQKANQERFAQQARERAAAAKKGTTKGAVAPTTKAPAKKAPAKAQAATEETERRTLYYDRAMDTLTRDELVERVEVGMAAAHANAQQGTPENMLVAEILERWCKRAERRINGIDKGKIQVRS